MQAVAVAAQVLLGVVVLAEVAGVVQEEPILGQVQHLEQQTQEGAGAEVRAHLLELQVALES